MDGSISILTYESYHYAPSRDMTQAPCNFRGTCVKNLSPFNG